MKILFLDIDGVLNGHEIDVEAQSATFRKDCVAQLNRIIRETGASVVISSAWRYMIHGGAMTIRGFHYMLRTHWVTADMKIVGITPEDVSGETRGDQIQKWLASADPSQIERYVVLDDLDLGISGRHPFVRTNGEVGLTESDANEVIRILGKAAA